jgi:hypothetical protein
MKQADNFNPGKWLVENKLTSQSQLNEMPKILNPRPGANVKQILANIGEDLDQMLETEPMIEYGTELWLAIVEEITGKNPYDNDTEYTEEESEALSTLTREAEALGIEFV